VIGNGAMSRTCHDPRTCLVDGAKDTMTTSARIIPYKVQPAALELMLGFSKGVQALGLPDRLQDLIHLRASQLNGCAVCVDMHARDAREHGEQQQRLDLLPVWRETDLFDDRERAALAWTEVLTQIPSTGVDDPAYGDLVAAFGEKDAVAVTLAVIVINCWNRMNVGFRVPLPRHPA
jgi:AhpD family alkylhydroperoxidase